MQIFTETRTAVGNISLMNPNESLTNP